MNFKTHFFLSFSYKCEPGCVEYTISKHMGHCKKNYVNSVLLANVVVRLGEKQTKFKFYFSNRWKRKMTSRWFPMGDATWRGSWSRPPCPWRSGSAAGRGAPPHAGAPARTSPAAPPSPRPCSGCCCLAAAGDRYTITQRWKAKHSLSNGPSLIRNASIRSWPKFYFMNKKHVKKYAYHYLTYIL